MSKSVTKNYIYNVGYQLLVIILPLITTPYVSRIFGAEGLGIYDYTASISQYFILFGALGLNLYGQREVAYHQNDKEGYTRVLKEIVVLKAVFLTIALGIYIGMAFMYTRYTYAFLVRIIDIVAAIVDISWFFQGLEEFKKIVIRNFIVKLTGVAAIFLFVRKPSDLYIYILCYSATLLLGNISMWFYLPGILEKGVRLTKKGTFTHLRPALALFVPQISISIYVLLDKSMIGLLTGSDAEVGYYGQAEKIVKLLLTIITAMGTVMLPRIASVFAENNKEQIDRYMQSTFRFVLLVSIPLTFGVLSASDHFVPWFFGDGYDKVVPNMMVVAPILIFIGMSNCLGVQFLLAVKRQREYTISVVCGAVLNLVLNLILIPMYMSIGAAVATVAAEFTVMTIQLYFVRHDFDLKRVCVMAVKYIIFSVVMAVVLVIEGKYLGYHIYDTILQAATGGVVFLLLMLVFDRATVMELLAKIGIKRKN